MLSQAEKAETLGRCNRALEGPVLQLCLGMRLQETGARVLPRDERRLRSCASLGLQRQILLLLPLTGLTSAEPRSLC